MNNTLEAWLKDNMPEAWFAGYDVADSALIALNEYRQAMDRLRAQVAERDATIERHSMESVVKDMRIESLTASLEDMRNRWKDAEQDWMQLRAEIAKRDATIAELRAQVATLTERLSRCTCTDDYGDVKE